MAFASTVILGSEFRRTSDHILLSHDFGSRASARDHRPVYLFHNIWNQRILLEISHLDTNKNYIHHS
jgi:hypothetical protein